jgi:hypothetical protein
LELLFLVLIAPSAGTGFILRGRVHPGVRRGFRVVGLGALGVMLVTMGIVLMGWWPFEISAAGVAALSLLAVAGLALPCAVTVR